MITNDTTTLTIEGQQLGSKRPLFPTRKLELNDDLESLSLRQLLRRIVLAELDAFARRQDQQQLFRVLSAQQIAAGKTAGRVDPSAKEYRQKIDPEEAVGIALQAFEDGLYFVFVDGTQVESLAAPVALTPDSTVKFIRLVALAGG